METSTRLHGLTKQLTGQRFGRLTVLAFDSRERDRSGRSLVKWKCQCSCGNEFVTRSANLLNGSTNSCGCLQREDIRDRSWKHGHTPRNKAHSAEYSAWRNMLSRCTNPNAEAYPWYGGRGISVCARWQRFDNFLSDMGLRHSKAHTIERIDVNGNYEASNCIWATRAEQGANKRNNRLLTAFGETRHMQEWCRIKGIPQRTLWNRLDRGMAIEDALSAPILPRGKYAASRT